MVMVESCADICSSTLRNTHTHSLSYTQTEKEKERLGENIDLLQKYNHENDKLLCILQHKDLSVKAEPASHRNIEHGVQVYYSILLYTIGKDL